MFSSCSNFKPKIALSCVFLLAALVSSGCGGGGGGTGGGSSSGGGGMTPPPPPPTTSSISGSVTSSVEGPPVPSATVSLLQNGSATGQSTTSTGTGAFTLTKVSSGTYDVLSTKSGYASSRYQDVVVGKQSVAGLSLPMFPTNGVGHPGATPVISVDAASPQPNGNVSGSQTFNISVGEAGATPNAINNIILRVGGNSVASAQNSSTMTQAVDFGQFPAGTVTVTIVAQDVADDVTSWTYTVSNGGSGTAPATNFSVSPLAQTFGQDLQILMKKREVLWNKYHLLGSPSQLHIEGANGSSRVIDLSKLSGIQPSSTAPGTSIAVSMEIDYNSGGHPSGYNIFRATTSTGPYTLLGSVPSGDCAIQKGQSSCADATFNDFDPGLSPGTTYFYQAQAYNGSATGTPIPASPPPVKILGTFHVDLTSVGGPASSSAATTPDTSTTPTLIWSNSGAVGTEQVYDPFILSQTNNYTSSFLCGGNTLNGGNPIVVVKLGSLVSPSNSTVTVSNSGSTITFPYSNFGNSAVTPFSCSSPLLGGTIFEWDLAESIAEGSEFPVNSGNFLSISVGNGEAYTGGESLSSGSDNGAFFFTTTP